MKFDTSATVYSRTPDLIPAPTDEERQVVIRFNTSATYFRLEASPTYGDHLNRHRAAQPAVCFLQLLRKPVKPLYEYMITDFNTSIVYNNRLQRKPTLQQQLINAG